MSEPIRIGDLSIAKLIVDLTDNPRDEEYRQMVIYEIMKRCGEPITKCSVDTLRLRRRDSIHRREWEEKIIFYGTPA